MADLAAALAAVDRRAAALREGRGVEGTEADLGAVAASGGLLERFVADVDEACRQVFTAGLAYPDPELADELAVLGERAARHGLARAVQHLGRLEVLVRAIGPERDHETRLERVQGAWHEAQCLVTWLRLFRTELGFLLVEARLQGGRASSAEVVVPTRSLECWPVGLELSDSGRVLIYALEVETGETVVLRDHLSDWQPEAPLARPVISRLFQDQILLGRVMRCALRLADHPVVEREEALLFRPAFRATPRLVPVTEEYRRPGVPPWADDKPAYPAALAVEVRVRSGRQTWSEAIAPSPVLRLNIAKLLAREAESTRVLDLVVRPDGDHLRILAACTEDDGVVFPADDPLAFRIAPRHVALAAVASEPELDEAEAVRVLAAASLFGGLDLDAREALRERAAAAVATSLDGWWRLGVACLALGVPARSPEDWLRDALRLAALAKADPVPLADLGRLLGRRASPADLPRVADRLAWQALWLAVQTEVVEALDGPIRTLVGARYSGKADPGVEAVCARALAVRLVEALDEDDSGAAAAFLESHLDALIPGRGARRRKRPPLPDAGELYALADTHALVAGLERAHALAGLGLPRLAVASSAADALLAWRSHPDDPVLASRAADALLVVAGAALTPLIFT